MVDEALDYGDEGDYGDYGEEDYKTHHYREDGYSVNDANDYAEF